MAGYTYTDLEVYPTEDGHPRRSRSPHQQFEASADNVHVYKLYLLTYLLTYLLVYVLLLRSIFGCKSTAKAARLSNRQIINLAKLAFRPRKVTDYSMHKKLMPVTILRTWTVSSHY